jgi:PhzF family phenazine biosynthesis protein
MTVAFPFHQVDVFTATPLLGNPLAVVHGADALGDATMAAFAKWTNLSETTFLLKPQSPQADYRVRIFTPGGELPFAGHPTLGSCHAWLSAGNRPRQAQHIVQECQVGLVRIRRNADTLAFAAPPLLRTGPVEEALLLQAARGLGIPRDAILAHQWVDNGPGWMAVMLASAGQVLAIRPDMNVLKDMKLGVFGPCDEGSDTRFEVRAFVGPLGIAEDPVTGSLNAGLASWLIPAGLAPAAYVASQGTALGRQGRVHIQSDGDTVWVGGQVVTCIQGTVSL